MTSTFDLVCIGTGPAATAVAVLSAKQGLKVAVVESEEFGGTCALHGCNPKKVFTNAAALIDQLRHANEKLVRAADPRIVWSDLVNFQHEFTDPIRQNAEGKLRKHGITTIQGTAQFESEAMLRVDQLDVTAPHFFIGVGARPNPLNICGGDLVTTSDEFMELNSLPHEVLFLGGGFISFEFANLIARLGRTVTIADRNDVPLKSFDSDLVRLLCKASKDVGIELLTNTEAVAIERANRRYAVRLRHSQRETTVISDLVVHGGGRVPNLDRVNLQAGKIDFGPHGIKVNEYLQSTSNQSVYAAGDCADSGLPMLTTTATAAARIAAKNIIASHQAASFIREGTPRQSFDQRSVPQVVFSVPPLAAVGLSEVEAHRAGFDLDVRYEDLSKKGEVRKLAASVAGCKLLIDRKSDRLLGAHVLGPHADEVINVFTIAINSQWTASKMKSAVFAYPTMTAEYLSVL